MHTYYDNKNAKKFILILNNNNCGHTVTNHIISIIVFIVKVQLLVNDNTNCITDISLTKPVGHRWGPPQSRSI